MIFLLLILIILALAFDGLIAFFVWTLYKYIDYKYFSTLEISLLKEENKMLKQENKKVGGTSSNFWEDSL